MEKLKNIPKDKWPHFGACAIAAILEPWLGVGLAIGKEYGDYKAIGKWEWDDSIADAIGVIVGGAIHFAAFGTI